MQHTFYCNKCDDEYSIYIEDYYPADELLEIMLNISELELQKAWFQDTNGLLYCGSCKPKGAKIYELKNYLSKRQ